MNNKNIQLVPSLSHGNEYVAYFKKRTFNSFLAKQCHLISNTSEVSGFKPGNFYINQLLYVTHKSLLMVGLK